MSDSEHFLSIRDWIPALEHLWDFEAKYVLGGGLAVSVWAERYIDQDHFAGLNLPIRSKDIDFRGTKALVGLFRDWIREDGENPANYVVHTRKNNPELGKVFAIPLNLAGIETTIEILERFPLLDDNIESEPVGSSIAVGHVRVLDPFSLIVCKLHASNSRPQEEQNNDLKHLRILKEVLPRFTEEALKRHSGGSKYLRAKMRSI